MYENITPNKFYKNLHFIMAEKEISSKEIICFLKIHENTFYSWSLFFPRLSTVMKLADYLGVSINELLVGKDE